MRARPLDSRAVAGTCSTFELGWRGWPATGTPPLLQAPAAAEAGRQAPAPATALSLLEMRQSAAGATSMRAALQSGGPRTAPGMQCRLQRIGAWFPGWVAGYGAPLQLGGPLVAREPAPPVWENGLPRYGAGWLPSSLSALCSIEPALSARLPHCGLQSPPCPGTDLAGLAYCRGLWVSVLMWGSLCSLEGCYLSAAAFLRSLVTWERFP